MRKPNKLHNLSEIDAKFIEDFLNKIYDSELGDFDEIFRIEFIGRFIEGSNCCEFDSKSNEYKDPIVKEIYKKSKSFFMKKKDIQTKIKEIKSEIDRKWKRNDKN